MKQFLLPLLLLGSLCACSSSDTKEAQVAEPLPVTAQEEVQQAHQESNTAALPTPDSLSEEAREAGKEIDRLLEGI